jgi:hypothetical protein
MGISDMPCGFWRSKRTDCNYSSNYKYVQFGSNASSCSTGSSSVTWDHKLH